MAILKYQEDGTITITGELNCVTVPKIFQQGKVLIQKYKQLDFNLAGVSHSDSTGLALLLSWLRKARQLKKVIRYHSLPKQMLAMAHLSDLDTVLPLIEK
jgi:phospholipid transport system transporter-binding protein